MSATNEPQASTAASGAAKCPMAGKPSQSPTGSQSHRREQPAGAYWSKLERARLKAEEKRFALERWTIVPQYPNYLISDCGQVKGVTKILTPVKDSRGALVVALRNHLYTTSFRIARLVGAAFCPTYKEDLYPLYLDGNPSNCHHSNLQWVARSKVTGIPFSRKPKHNQ